MSATCPSSLDAAVDAWTLQVVAAHLVLVRLYRSLGDEGQAAAILRVAAPSVERMERLRIQAGLGGRVEALLQAHPDNTDAEAEAAAWQQIIGGLAGILAFFALVEGTPGPGLRGPRQATTKAFALALQSYRKAFPDVLAEEGTALAIKDAIQACTGLFLDLQKALPEARMDLQGELEVVIRRALYPYLERQ